MGSTATASTEKTAEELEREIEELDRQRKEISDRIRDPKGIRRGGLASNGLGSFNLRQQRGPPAHRSTTEDQRPPKRRLSSAVVMVKEEGEVTTTAAAAAAALDGKERDAPAPAPAAFHNGKESSTLPLPHHAARFITRDANRSRPFRTTDSARDTNVPRVLPQDSDPSLVNRNKRMLGSILGTLEKFQKEDMHLSATEAYMRRSDSMQRALQRSREESEQLRQKEREKIAENRRRDLTLQARLAAKAEEKKLELLFLKIWSEHNNTLGNFLRTKAQPSIYYLPTKQLEEDEAVAQQRKEKAFLEWKIARREELSEYQKQIGEQYLANVEMELEKWQTSKNTRRGNNSLNLQETMDKELETHQLEHGPKRRNIPGGAGNDDEDDVEDINVGEDDIMEDMLVTDDNNRRNDAESKPEVGNASPGFG